MLYLLIFCLTAVISACPDPPNVVLIISDDMGWNDVSYHGSDQILTPNIDALAYAGVALQKYYSYSTCTPSRSALLTGKYSHKIGMQGYPIANSEDRGIPLSEKLLPEYLQDLGYRTHLIGKWHVGGSRQSYLPTHRGFDSHFGYRAGKIDYYEYIAEEQWNTKLVAGFDLFRNETPAWNVSGYLTDVLTDEAVNVISSHDACTPLFLQLAHAAPHAASVGSLLEVPPESVRANRHVKIPSRRYLAGMMSRLDSSIGRVMGALEEKNMLTNTIVIFIADNGGMTKGLTNNFASNYPLRGEKFSPFEGGVRVSGVIWADKIKSNIWEGTMHVTDWLPTILSAVGGKPPLGIDGVDLWSNIINGSASKRKTTVVDINDVEEYASVMIGDYKLITGNVLADYGEHLSEHMLDTIGEVPDYWETLTKSKTYEVLSKLGRGPGPKWKVQRKRLRMTVECMEKENMCVPAKDKSCLFNLASDPCEYEDLSSVKPELTTRMLQLINQEIAKTIPRIPFYRDPLSDPELHNNTWVPWIIE